MAERRAADALLDVRSASASGTAERASYGRHEMGYEIRMLLHHGTVCRTAAS